MGFSLTANVSYYSAFTLNYLNSRKLAPCKPTCRCPVRERGKSGQRRAPYFLTGRGHSGDGMITASATENKPPNSCKGVGKGEMVG